MTTQVIVNVLILILAIVALKAALFTVLYFSTLSDLRAEMRESGHLRLYAKALQRRLSNADRDAAIAEANAAQQQEVQQ